MSKEIKGFITKDDFIYVDNKVVAPIYELSDISLTYSRTKQQYYSIVDSTYSLYVFNMVSGGTLTQDEVERVLKVVTGFSQYLTMNILTNKQQTIVLFINDYNLQYPDHKLTNLNYNTVVSYNSIKSVDYITFTVGDVNCTIWLSDEVFKAFYPDYEIDIVLPFDNFVNKVTNTTDFITALENFDIISFNKQIEVSKNGYPTTYTKIINVPYRVPNTTVTKNCYFAFNIYGIQGNYDYILKLTLYNYLVNELGLDAAHVENVFPTMLNINEFFITPRWDKVAIPAQIGQIGISSQITPTYSEAFDLDKYIRIFTDTNYLKNNTYNVPFDYNNILLHVTNGFYTEVDVKDFKKYYGDLITVTSSHPDFARMSRRTQKFVTLLENILDVSNSNNSSEMFNKILKNQDYHFTIINRGGMSYLSFFYEQHQYYVLPRYVMLTSM